MNPAQIKAFRLDKLGLTQKQLSRAMGVSKRTVESWEQGERGFPQMQENKMRGLLDKKARS